MKKIGLLLGLISIGLVGTISCSKDDNKQVEQPVKNLTIDKSEVGLLVGISEIVSITDGNGGYSVKSSDESKVTASVKANQVTIEAKAEGQATVTITDSKEKSVVIKVNVSDFIVSATEVNIISGRSENVTIKSGSGNYGEKSENEDVATAEIINNNEVKITAKNIGTTRIIVTDKKTNKEVSIAVKVVNDLKMEKVELVITNGDYEIIHILGGNNANDNYEFEITATPADVVNVEHQWFDATQGHHLKVKGLKPGEATVTVTDKQTQQVTTFKAIVNLSEFSIPTQKVELSSGKSTTINITGNGKYEVSSANPSVATASESNGILTIIVVGSGSTEITVKDVLKNETKTVTVVAKPSFTVDDNGVLTAVEPSAIVAILVIPENVKEIKDGDKPFDNNKNTIQTVTMEGIEKIGTFAFAFQSELTTVVIGDKIKEINNFAFALCAKLNTIKVKSVTPPTLKGNPFMRSSPQNLKVPVGSKAAYEASAWKNYFTNIIEE